MDPSDDTLVHRVKDGDQEAFGTLYHRYLETLTRRVFSVVRDDATADDISQEAFIRAWQQIGQLATGAAFRSWIFRIGTNLALNHVRTVKRRREQPLEPPRRWEEEDQSVPEWMIDHTTEAPDAEVEQSEQADAYRRFVDQLPEDKRETFKLVYDAELELKEVAARLGIPEGTVKSRVYHARRTLASRWRRTFNDTED